MARKKFVSGNWKMHRTAAEARTLAREVRAAAEPLAERVDVAIAPPFTALHAAAAELSGSRIGLGAQNLHWESQGAFTGEVSAPMLVDAGCRYVLCGHSERRQFFGDTDEAVQKKTRAALAAGLHPIVCVGETLPERESGRTLEVVGRQVRAALSGLTPAQVGGLTVAYEPVWAIGTGKTASVGPGPGGPRGHPRDPEGARAGRRRIRSHPLRRLREARQRRRAHVPAGRGRRAGGRREPQGSRLHRDHPGSNPLNTFLIVVHVIVSAVLVIVILLQAGKGSGLGGAFGGQLAGRLRWARGADLPRQGDVGLGRRLHAHVALALLPLDAVRLGGEGGTGARRAGPRRPCRPGSRVLDGAGPGGHASGPEHPWPAGAAGPGSAQVVRARVLAGK